MPLHRLTTLTLGVPDVAAAAAFYREFGLGETAPGRFATVAGGEQLVLTPTPRRRLVDLGLGADAPADLERVAAALAAIGVAPERHTDGALAAVDPATGVRVVVTVAPRLAPPAAPASPTNAPGRIERTNRPADGVLRDAPVRPLQLSHVALASADFAASRRFFVDGLGFAVSDELPMVAFLRAGTDHHQVAVQQGPTGFLHHTAWEVGDVDEVGRGGAAMVAADPDRHVWGLGRHAIGSNFFWYLRDPAGHYAEYVSDLDRITDGAAYTPPAWAGPQAVRAWAPPLPPEFLMPRDLPELLA